jgi:ligand-binding SRPBCC domain-containing protein
MAPRDLDADRAAGSAVFTYRSVVPAPAADVFEWHERPEAVLALIPSRRFVRIESQTGGLRDGGRVTLSIGVGPLRLRWEARHFGYIRGTQFCDEQVRGPFKIWRHMHRIEPIGIQQSLYEDRVEYSVRGGPLVRRLAHPVLQRLLVGVFAHRHRVVRAAMSDPGR